MLKVEKINVSVVIVSPSIPNLHNISSDLALRPSLSVPQCPEQGASPHTKETIQNIVLAPPEVLLESLFAVFSFTGVVGAI